MEQVANECRSSIRRRRKGGGLLEVGGEGEEGKKGKLKGNEGSRTNSPREDGSFHNLYTPPERIDSPREEP